MSTLRNKLKKLTILKSLSSLKITVTCLFLLFVLTFWGTVAQVENGLYYSQNRYFYSFFFLVFGFFPFPGARAVLWVLFANLLSVTITRFQFRWSQIGILLIHLGLLSYFVSAFVTFHGAKESQLTLWEKEGSNVSAAYHDWELSVYEKFPDRNKVIAYHASDFKKGMNLPFEKYGLNVVIKEYYPNCEAYASRGQATPVARNDSGIHSLAQIPLEKEPERNFPGGVFVFEVSKDQYIDILLYGGESNPTRIANTAYYAQLRRKRNPLPFVLLLKDFRKEFHPNTEIARSFQSLVEISNDDLSREVLISMNEPLRYKNFTLYQASYAIDPSGREQSTLAVVQNTGRLLPYFSSLITFLGLVIHFLMMAFAKRGKKQAT